MILNTPLPDTNLCRVITWEQWQHHNQEGQINISRSQNNKMITNSKQLGCDLNVISLVNLQFNKSSLCETWHIHLVSSAVCSDYLASESRGDILATNNMVIIITTPGDSHCHQLSPLYIKSLHNCHWSYVSLNKWPPDSDTTSPPQTCCFLTGVCSWVGGGGPAYLLQ